MFQNRSKESGYRILASAGGHRSLYTDSDSGLIEKSRLPFFLILFFISPVLGALSAMFNFRQSGAKLTLTFFFGLFGYTLIMLPHADSFRIAQEFTYHYAFLSFSGFANELINILSLKGASVSADEPYFSILSYLVSRFTNDSSIFFLVVGLIYGYFYVKSVSLVFSESRGAWNAALLILFIFFLSRVFLEGMNAPRTYTACWVLFTGTFLYLKTEDIKYVFLVLLTPFFHFAWAVMTIPFFIWFFFRDLKYLYVTVLVISFFASASFTVVEPYLSSTELGQSKIEGYVEGDRWDPATIAEYQASRSFHARYYQDVAYYSIYFMLFISLIWSGYFSNKYHDRLQNGLGSISILLLSLANFFSFISALNNRLMIAFGVFATAYLYRLYSKNWHELKNRQWIVYACLPFILFYLFTKYSIIGDFTDFSVLISPFLYPFLGEDPMSIKEFIRSLLL